MSLIISRAFVDAIAEQSRAEYPDECCGVILGPVGSGKANRLKPMINAAHSPTFYEFDPKDLLAATAFWSLVKGRRIVGMRTSILMASLWRRNTLIGN